VACTVRIQDASSNFYRSAAGELRGTTSEMYVYEKITHRPTDWVRHTPQERQLFRMPAGCTVVEYVVCTSICNPRSDAGDGHLLL
jgi:hypothetical protein